MAKFAKFWLPMIVWAGFIFYLSAQPGLNSGLAVFWDVFLRKLAHASEFGILNFLVFRALWQGEQKSFRSSLIISFAVAIIYAFSDEGHQYFVPGREAKLKDVGIDSLGVVAISFCLLFWNRIRRKQI